MRSVSFQSFFCLKRFHQGKIKWASFVLCKWFLQTRMCSHPVGLDVWFLVGPFFYCHTSCVRTAKAQVRLRGCAGSLEPSLVTYVISTIILCTGSFPVWNIFSFHQEKIKIFLGTSKSFSTFNKLISSTKNRVISKAAKYHFLEFYLILCLKVNEWIDVSCMFF